MQHVTTDTRVRKIDSSTWIDIAQDKFVFEGQAEDGSNLGINVYNLRKGPGQQPPLNEVPFATLDEAIAEYLGAPS